MKGRALKLVVQEPVVFPKNKTPVVLSALNQNSQQLKPTLSNESLLIYYKDLQVSTSKRKPNVRRNYALSIDTNNTLLTGLEPCIGQIIRAGNTKIFLEAIVPINRELRLSYFETQKFFLVNHHNKLVYQLLPLQSYQDFN